MTAPIPAAAPVPVLAVEGLSVSFRQGASAVDAVRDVSIAVQPGECVAVVGESGSGKTQLCMAVMGLLESNAVARGSVRFEGQELLGAPSVVLNEVRGSRMAMIFQDPMSSLTPHLKVGVQLAEVLVCHRGMSWRDAEIASVNRLDSVRIPDAPRRMNQYPHELSGGLRQRVVIAMSLQCNPSLVIADEPTTALDVTVQAQILELLRDTRRDHGMALVLITHDFSIVAGLAERIVVMYAGRVVEVARADELFSAALHPYTIELLKCVPDLLAPRLDRLPTLPGQPPNPAERIEGCSFAARCTRASERCRLERPLLAQLSGGGAGRLVACHHPCTP